MTGLMPVGNPGIVGPAPQGAERSVPEHTGVEPRHCRVAAGTVRRGTQALRETRVQLAIGRRNGQQGRIPAQPPGGRGVPRQDVRQQAQVAELRQRVAGRVPLPAQRVAAVRHVEEIRAIPPHPLRPRRDRTPRLLLPRREEAAQGAVRAVARADRAEAVDLPEDIANQSSR